ncbi:hypothetical protein [Streptomyces violascens]|uniref:hypothetical protein n=1 Tax=Streptomyces violascens TaxID=67381 RepID=UPI0016743922|nr:hypothetical protein [Streptomyces violascens]GGU43032.1 hypothetical protein GCM10010289_74810 [Streptomyces violascens]
MDIYRSGGSFDNNSGSIGRVILPDPVPAGKRLVIETVTGFYSMDNGGVLGSAFLTASNSGLEYAFPWVPCGPPPSGPPDRRFYGFNYSSTIYIDGPATLQFDAAGASGGPILSGTYTVTGTLESL